MSDRSSQGGGKAGPAVAAGRPADPRTNTLVKRVLRVGLVTALVLLLAGLVVQLASGHDQAVQVKMFDIFAAPSVGEKIMGLGILALTLTPAAGVLSVLGSWVRERDRVFVGVGAIVVTVLAVAVVVGIIG